MKGTTLAKGNAGEQNKNEITCPVSYASHVGKVMFCKLVNTSDLIFLNNNMF